MGWVGYEVSSGYSGAAGNQPYNLNPQPLTLHTKLCTLQPESKILNPGPATLHP